MNKLFFCSPPLSGSLNFLLCLGFLHYAQVMNSMEPQNTGLKKYPQGFLHRPTTITLCPLTNFITAQ